MSDTPRTDALIHSQSFVDETRIFHRDDYIPLLDHARALEREIKRLNHPKVKAGKASGALRQRIAELEAQDDGAAREAMCKIACQLRASGAQLPVENKGTIESAISTGLSIALMLIETELTELMGGEDAMRSAVEAMK